jgi:predicted kinase
LQLSDRQQFIELAESRNVRWHLLDVTASESVMRKRIAARHAGRSDASEADLAVLDHQLRNHDPITPFERPHLIPLNTDNEWEIAGVLAVLR